MEDCTCDLRTRLIGDGCSVCNPTLALACADETIDELRAVNAELLEALELLASYGDVFAYRGGEENPYTKACAAIARAKD